MTLKATGKKLPRVSYKLALPRGKKLSDIKAVVIALPPGGTAPLFAPESCARNGIGSVAIGAAARSDWGYLASLALAVAADLKQANGKLKFIYCGFSAGGFASELAAGHRRDDLAGLLQVGAYPGTYQKPFPPGVPTVVLLGRTDFNHDPALPMIDTLRGRGGSVELVEHDGGHTWGAAASQSAALETLLKLYGTPANPWPTETHTAALLPQRALTMTFEEAKRVLGKPSVFDLGYNLKPNEGIDIYRAIRSKQIEKDFPKLMTVQSAVFPFPGRGIAGLTVSIVFGTPKNSQIVFDAETPGLEWRQVAAAIGLPSDPDRVGNTHDSMGQVDRLFYNLPWLAAYQVEARSYGAGAQVVLRPQEEAKTAESVLVSLEKGKPRSIFARFKPSLTRGQAIARAGLPEAKLGLKLDQTPYIGQKPSYQEWVGQLNGHRVRVLRHFDGSGWTVSISRKW